AVPDDRSDLVAADVVCAELGPREIGTGRSAHRVAAVAEPAVAGEQRLAGLDLFRCVCDSRPRLIRRVGGQARGKNRPEDEHAHDAHGSSTDCYSASILPARPQPPNVSDTANTSSLSPPLRSRYSTSGPSDAMPSDPGSRARKRLSPRTDSGT